MASISNQPFSPPALPDTLTGQPGEVAEMGAAEEGSQEGLQQGLLKGGDKSFMLSSLVPSFYGEKMTPLLKENASFQPKASKEFTQTEKGSLLKFEKPLTAAEKKFSESKLLSAKHASPKDFSKSHEKGLEVLKEAGPKNLAPSPKEGKKEWSSFEALKMSPPLPQTALHQPSKREDTSPKKQLDNLKKERDKEAEKTRAQANSREGKVSNPETKEPTVESKQSEEEGFAENSRDKEKQDQEEEKETSPKIETLPLSRQVVSFSQETSSLSLIGHRISHLDILLLFIEVLKLALRGKEQERISRWQERELQIKHMMAVVDTYQYEGKALLSASIGSGILAIISGICPIAGLLGGEKIIEKLSTVIKSLRGADADKLFKAGAKITEALSAVQKSTGDIKKTFSEGKKAFEQHMADLHRTDAEENTRTMDEIKDAWRNIESFLHQALQMQHDAVNQLYR